jgi:hypothetical protein
MVSQKAAAVSRGDFPISLSRRALSLMAIATAMTAVMLAPTGFVPAKAQDASAGAEPGSVRAAMAATRTACAGDIDHLCASVQPGAGRIERCIFEHHDELGSACRAAADQLRTAQLASRAVGSSGQCSQDVKSFCSDVQRGGGKIISCLKDHASQLQPACKSAVEGGRQ